MGAVENMSALPPLSVTQSAEQSILGVLMREGGAVEIARTLRPEHFEDTVCQTIYQAILDCCEVGDQPSSLSVCERLERAGKLAECGGLEFVGMLAFDSVGNAESLSRIILRNFRRGKLHKLGLRIVDAAESRTIDPQDLASMVVTYARQMTAADTSQASLIIDVDQLHERHAAQSWAVKGVIPANAVGMFFGASGTFKSFVALDYAMHRCYGLPWLGRRTQKGIPVYLAAEGGAGLMRRVEAWHKLRGLDWRKCPMKFVTTPISIQGDAAKLRDAIDSLGIIPSDIIVDTMSQTFAGEENSSTEVAGYLSHLGGSLREPYGSTVLVIHHSGHAATERPRGSSAIIANTDFLFGVYRDEKEPIATLECVKQKDGDRLGPVSFALNYVSLGQDSDGDEMGSLAARHIAGAEEIIAAAQSSKGAPSALVRLLNAIGTGAPEEEVRDRFYRAMPESDSDARRQAYYRALKRAEGQGIVVREGDWIAKNGGNGA